MRKTRLMQLAVAAAFTTLMMVMLPSTASAEQHAMSGASPAVVDPADVPAERTVMAADVRAAEFETNFAVAGSLPPRSELTCHSVRAVEICYQAYGDRWWVQDQEADGASAAVYWENFRGGNLYRYGMCVNSLGNGAWGQCNKNYYENSVLNGFPCVWDRSSGEDAVCNSSGWRFQ